MKYLLISFIILLFFSSCHNYKKDAERLTQERDSISNEAALRDSLIVDALNDFNEIQAALDSIKQLEQIVSVSSEQGNNMSRSQKQKILNDIAILNSLIQQNKEKTANLQKKLNGANYRIGKLNKTITELEKMVQGLEKQVAQRDNEIMALNEKVSKLNVDISTLNQKIAEIELESREKTSTIELQTLAMNKAYYAYGSVKELREANVTEKAGGFLGIGKAEQIRKDFNRDYFTEIDIREFDYIPLMMKKADVLSVHPAGSFHITGENTADTLFIDDKAEFWKAAKYLVILTK